MTKTTRNNYPFMSSEMFVNCYICKMNNHTPFDRLKWTADFGQDLLPEIRPILVFPVWKIAKHSLSCSVLSLPPLRLPPRMLWRRIHRLCFHMRRSFTKSGLLLPGQCAAIWDPADPTSKQMASYFTHPDQIPVSDSEKLDNTIDACVTTLDRVIGYCRAGSVFPQTFGLACCAMEMIEACHSIGSVINRPLLLDSISSVLVWFLVLRKSLNLIDNGLVPVRLILWLCLELLQTRWLLPSVV